MGLGIRLDTMALGELVGFTIMLGMAAIVKRVSSIMAIAPTSLIHAAIGQF